MHRIFALIAGLTGLVTSCILSVPENTAGETGPSSSSSTTGGGEGGATATSTTTSASGGHSQGGSGGAGGGGGATKTYAEAITEDGPAGWWRFNDPAGSPTAMAEAGGINATFSGDEGMQFEFGAPSLLASDPGNSAMRLTQQSGKIQMGNNFRYGGKAPFTIEIWVRVESMAPPTGSNRHLLGAYSNATGYRLEFNATEVQLRRGCSNGDSLCPMAGITRAATIESMLDPPVALGKTTFVAGTFDGMDGCIYAKDSNNPTRPPVCQEMNFDIVFSDVFEIQTNTAIVDEAAVYSSVLTEEQIQAHYDAGALPRGGG